MSLFLFKRPSQGAEPDLLFDASDCLPGGMAHHQAVYQPSTPTFNSAHASGADVPFELPGCSGRRDWCASLETDASADSPLLPRCFRRYSHGASQNAAQKPPGNRKGEKQLLAKGRCFRHGVMHCDSCYYFEVCDARACDVGGTGTCTIGTMKPRGCSEIVTGDEVREDWRTVWYCA